MNVCRRPCVFCPQILPAVYTVGRVKETRGVSVYLANMKLYQACDTPPAPDFDTLAEFSLNHKILLPALDPPGEAQLKMESYIADSVIDHKNGWASRGKRNATNWKRV